MNKLISKVKNVSIILYYNIYFIEIVFYFQATRINFVKI